MGGIGRLGYYLVSLFLASLAIALLALLALMATQAHRPPCLSILIIALATALLILMGWLVVRRKIVCAPITVVP